jgi:hypothetical protein
MPRRRKIPDAVQTEIAVRSRRRCCICFGLHRDDKLKKGQVAHLDQNRDNNDPDNLAFLCFDHHDEYDGQTSTSKGLTTAEVKRYRQELYDHFEGWGVNQSNETLLRFLARTITPDQMADGAVDVAAEVVWYAETLAYEALVCSKVDYSDGDLLVPHLMCLDAYSDWGWLKYTTEERPSKYDGEMRTFITVTLTPTCRRVADVIRKRIIDKEGDSKKLDGIDAAANSFTDDEY